ncbi:hypothetical protein SARC_07292 [Sphaeroforma arctica JP610]|uniref:Ion transport domain-containing protein n=1 Tax=Sphaeroforma arctica JP610 TaxID=667725 RepID=A0A0L0FUV7_9EUKA|nr:hypothetical protein SARC_07292 [Sphaeroforma arctica JP610]KNC80346.1 hypothetical protein SARC_07292 [Sphaeroforma arctica JP610]|eukprot:XP_014154248.1 hypothetical protein SARC_07292 [Sphaeroforma arctica JP610]
MERGGERQPLLSEQIEDLDYDLEEPTFRRRLYRVMEAKNTLGRYTSTSILGAGFMDNIEDRRAQKSETEVQVGEETLFMEVENTKPNVCTSCMDERLEHMTLQERLFAFLESHTKAGRLFEKTIFGLIILNVIAFMLETVHSIDHTKGGSLFFSCFEAFSVAVFTIEFALRLYACPVDATLSKYGPVVARLKYCMRFYSIVDLLAIVPFYVDLFLPQDLPAATFMRVLRLVRMLRRHELAWQSLRKGYTLPGIRQLITYIRQLAK